MNEPAPKQGFVLSGWARLWIVITGIVFVVASMSIYGSDLSDPCTRAVENRVHAAEQRSGEIESADGVVKRREAAEEMRGLCRELVRRGAWRADTIVVRSGGVQRAVGIGFAVALATWLTAMSAKLVGVWVWQGFRRSGKPLS